MEVRLISFYLLWCWGGGALPLVPLPGPQLVVWGLEVPSWVLEVEGGAGLLRYP